MLTVIGEALLDVVQRSSGIEAHVGGSPLNVAVGLARLDHPVQFIGRYGRDAYGDSVAAHLRSSSVMVPLPPDEKPTSVATAQIDDDGAATYAFDLAWELPGLARTVAAHAAGRHAAAHRFHRHLPGARRHGGACRRRACPPGQHHQLRSQLPPQHHHGC